MASSVSGQDDPNRALWLGTRAGKMEPSCPLGTTCCIPQAKLSRKPYINPLLTKFAWSRWLGIGLDFVSVHKHTKKNSANIQRSWPHTWSFASRCSHLRCRLQCFDCLLLFFFRQYGWLISRHHFILRRPAVIGTFRSSHCCIVLGSSCNFPQRSPVVP